MKSMKTLSVDPGEKRVGLAICDDLGLTVRPLATLVRAADGALASALVDRAMREGATHILVGVPVRPSGQRGPEAQRSQGLIGALAEELSRLGVLITVEGVDESYTTTEASARLKERGVRPEQRKLLIDQEAAAVLLEDWLRSRPREEL